MLHESLDGPFTVDETLGHLLLPFLQRSWMPSLTFNEATLEVQVATMLQRFAMFLSGVYDILLGDTLSSYLLQYSSSWLIPDNSFVSHVPFF